MADTTPPGTTTDLVVSCADSGQLHRLALRPDGSLHSRQVLTPGGELMPMAQRPRPTPSGRRLYVVRRSPAASLLTLRIGAPGDADAAQLAPLAEAPLPASMPYVSTDRSGRWWLAASYGAHLVAVGAIDGEGIAQAPHQVLPVGRHAHAVVVDPANRWVHVPCLGDGVVHCLGLDPVTGQLQPGGPVWRSPRAGSGPRHLVITADGRRALLLNELDARIDLLDRDPDSGVMAWRQTCPLIPDNLPGPPAGAPWAAELRLSPDARWLAASERRGSTVSLFRLEDPPAGLTLADRVSVEARPRTLQWSTDGHHLLVAGQRSHHVAALALDPAAGRLRLTDRLPVGHNPNWIEVLAD